jgi:DNA-binding Lrp family transcriptional regulator
MSEERIEMTQQERDRLFVLRQAVKKQITQAQAAERLRVTPRWVRKLVKRWRKKGDGVVVHGLRGRASNHQIEARVERKVLGIVKREYPDFGPTLAAEYLAEEHRLVVSRETLRQWMIREGLWRRRRREREEIHVWRPRRSSFGELVQWDTSEHDWLEGRGPRLCYLAMIDDATSRVVGRFAAHDTCAENMRLLWRYLVRFGRPLAYYSDRDSIFYTTRQKRDGAWETEPDQTQMGRALAELGIAWIGARSPQAKGRIERHFDTAQDRLVKGLRKAGVDTLEGANQYLETRFLPWVNEHLTHPPAHPVDAHRPLGKEHDLAAILSQVDQRVVGNDYTLRLQGRLYRIARHQIRPGLRGSVVRVEQRLDGTLAVRFRQYYLAIEPCAAAPPPQRKARPKPAARQATGKRSTGWKSQPFDLHSGLKVWQAAQESGARRAPESTW